MRVTLHYTLYFFALRLQCNKLFIKQMKIMHRNSPRKCSSIQLVHAESFLIFSCPNKHKHSSRIPRTVFALCFVWPGCWGNKYQFVFAPLQRIHMIGLFGLATLFPSLVLWMLCSGYFLSCDLPSLPFGTVPVWKMNV